jgi:signal transduction histidine kinase
VRIRRIEQQFSLLTMAATLGHEINNPLTGVLGYLDFLEDSLREGDTAKSFEHVKRVRQSAERIREVVKQLMRLKKPRIKRYSTGRFTLDLAPESPDLPASPP